MYRELVGVMVTVFGVGICLYIETTDHCGPNEDFLFCGPACPLNCSTQDGPYICPDDAPDCTQGCFCVNGYLRNESGDCVEKEKCFDVSPTDCAENEEFLECGSDCAPTCTQPTPPKMCPLKCIKGCFCKAGFVRDEVTDLCVTQDQCSGDNCFSSDEMFSLCSANCVPSCEDPQPVCTSECASGCVCQPGLFRDDNGNCVVLEKCPVSNMTDIGLLASCLNLISKILHS